MHNQLTDRNFWANYWEAKPNLALPIPANYLFYKELEQVIKAKKPANAIELGGFPGYYSIFLRKYYAIDATLFDYFVHQPILSAMLVKNNLKKTDISIIEADLFSYQPQKKYDLVLSCGLIEHFKDTKDIIERHVQFLSPQGTLFITIPNFKSINGWIQKRVDYDNYSKHNIQCMDIKLLSAICKELGLKDISVNYIGRFSVWLENKHMKSLLTRVLVKMIWCTGKLLTKLIPFESKILSPYILIQAKKD